MTEHPELDAELKALNDAVTSAIEKRAAWMDAHMLDYAKYRVGDPIFDLGTGRQLGVVSRLYRYWAHHNELLDTSMSIEYEYEVLGAWSGPSRHFDNTSRQIALHHGTAADLESHLEYEIGLLRARKQDD